MNKWLVVFVLVALVVVSFFYFVGSGEDEESSGLSADEILEAVKPGIEEFCDYLDDNVEHSACAVCNFSQYMLVGNLNRPVPFDVAFYTIKESDDIEGYDVGVSGYVTYGSESKNGAKWASFVLDKEGNILSSEFPEETCAYNL